MIYIYLTLSKIRTLSNSPGIFPASSSHLQGCRFRWRLAGIAHPVELHHRLHRQRPEKSASNGERSAEP